MIGTLFLDRYQIASLLGQGGMGLVYRAHDQVLNRDVAIKVLTKASLGTEGRARMLGEAQAAAQLNHPNIVTIYDAGEFNQTPYIIMELVEGKSLHESPPTDIDELLAIARQICLALEHAHSRHIVHRDLKPENVCRLPVGLIKLMDFGLARSVVSRLTADGSIAGSVFYLAPELALGQEYDGRADLYALGVMLYEFATGDLPFSAPDPLAVISQHLHAPVVPPRARAEQIPARLEELILRLMSKRAEDRPASAGEVLRLLEMVKLADTQTVQELKPSLLDRIVRGRLVGREGELAEASAIWNRARSGEATALLVSGEPGIGKTRLAYEIIAQARVQGAYLLVGNCYAEGSAAYSPVAQMIETAAALYDLNSLSGLPNLLNLAPVLRPRYPEVISLPLNDLQAERERMFESLVELAAGLAGHAPLLLLLEDAHWADSGTLAILRHLVRRLSHLGSKMLLVLTYREVELDEDSPLAAMAYDLSRERLALRIKLARLDRDSTRKMLSALLSEEVTPQFLDGIYRETEGNPFFIEEVCKALIEQGDLYRQDGRWHWPSMQEIEIPQSIKVAIQARVSKLPAPAQEALRVAAIFGREFDFEALSLICDLDEESLIQALEQALRAQLLVELRQPGRKTAAVNPTYAFVHALVASTLREAMSALRRQRLHQRAALALERLNPNQTEKLARQLGRHFAEAGDWEKAADYLLQAGDQARQVYAYPEAIDLYQQALAIFKDQGEHERAARILMKLGLLYHTNYNFQSSRQAYQEGFALWKQAGKTPPAALAPAEQPLLLGWQDPLTLDPSFAFEAISIPLINQLFIGLVSLTPDMDVVPELAESWDVLENGRKFIFRLRSGVTWTDDTPVTAHDVEFAWRRVLDPDNHSPNSVLFFDILNARAFFQGEITDPSQIGVRVVDAHTLEVELEQPAGYFLHLLTYAVTYPVPRHLVEAKGHDWAKPGSIVTNGPFRLDEWIPGERLTLVRNHGYLGRLSGNLQRAEVSINTEYKAFSARLAAYDANRLDVISLGGAPGESERARQRHAGEYVTLPTANTMFMVLDTDHPPFDNVLVRRAFAQALDRETLAEVYISGIFLPATAGMVPPAFPAHQPEIALPYAPDVARQQMAQAGYPNGQGFPVIDAWAVAVDFPKFYEYLQDHWLEHLGVNIRWVTLASDELYRRLQDERPPLLFNGWLADYPDPDSFLRVCMAFQSRWRDPAYWQLVEKARQVTDQAERMRMYRQAELMLVEKSPVIPLFYGRSHLLIKPWVKHYPLSPIQSLVLKDILLDPHPG